MKTAWPWAVPLSLGLAVFTLVLLTTPPGFAAFGGIFGNVRGSEADAAAYALGAAASLALLVLGAAALVCFVVRRAVTRT